MSLEAGEGRFEVGRVHGREAFSGRDGTQPRIDAVHPTDAAGTPKELQLEEAAWTMTVRPPTSVPSMVARFPRGDGLQVEKARHTRLGIAPLHIMTAQQNGQEGSQHIMVGPELTAHDAAALLYFSSSYQYSYGELDIQDVIMDWKTLYDGSDRSNRLYKAHERMPGWENFEAERLQTLGVLERNFTSGTNFKDQDPTDTLVPVLRWEQGEGGQNKIILDPLEDSLRQAIADTLPERFTEPGQTDRMNSGMGLMYLTSYAEHNTQWADADTYIRNGTGPTKEIGPSQVLAYAYRTVAEMQTSPQTTIPANEDPQKSALLTNMGRYAQTGQVYNRSAKITFYGADGEEYKSW